MFQNNCFDKGINMNQHKTQIVHLPAAGRALFGVMFSLPAAGRAVWAQILTCCLLEVMRMPGRRHRPSGLEIMIKLV